MTALLEDIVVSIWNALKSRPARSLSGGLYLGHEISREGGSIGRVSIPNLRRAEHIVIWGRTGSGKSSAMQSMAVQDIEAGRGYVWIDFHDGIRFLLRHFAAKERRERIDLSPRIILIEPADPVSSVGLNILESSARSKFVLIAEFAKILKERWHLDHFGARTEELLRNTLFVLAVNGLTLLEIAIFLTNAIYRQQLLANVQNDEIRGYFENRYNQASDAMQGAMRDPILNKVSYISSDPAFRHILGQQHSTFNILDAIDQGCWILLNLSKAELGEQSQTLGSLFLTRLKAAVFQRRTKSLYTAYCDEIQNLVSFDDGIEVLLAESRKQSFGIVSANQFQEQLPATLRAAMLAVQTHLVFRLSSTDADKMASAFDGGKQLSHLLKTLPQRHAVLQSGEDSWKHIQLPTVTAPEVDTRDLVRRIRQRWARPRTEIEREIAARQPVRLTPTEGALDEWE